MSIPSEHNEHFYNLKLGYNFSHYEAQHQFKLVIETITWCKESHGLFDYETKFFNNQRFMIDKAKNMIRQESNCIIESKNQNIRQYYNGQAQLLFEVLMNRNCFEIHQPISYLLKNAPSKKLMQMLKHSPIDAFYNQNGQSSLDPFYQCDWLYYVIKNPNQYDYAKHVGFETKHPESQYAHVLEPGDVIKAGTIKFLIHEVSIRSQNERNEYRKRKEDLNRENYRKKVEVAQHHFAGS